MDIRIVLHPLPFTDLDSFCRVKNSILKINHIGNAYCRFGCPIAEVRNQWRLISDAYYENSALDSHRGRRKRSIILSHSAYFLYLGTLIFSAEIGETSTTEVLPSRSTTADIGFAEEVPEPAARVMEVAVTVPL